MKNYNEERVEGFTFIEVLITLFILSVGLMALSRMTLSVIKTNSRSSKISIAIANAQDRMEKLKKKKYRNLRSGKYTASGTGKGIDLEWIIKKDTPAINTALVVVTARWYDRNKEDSLKFSTIIGK